MQRARVFILLLLISVVCTFTATATTAAQHPVTNAGNAVFGFTDVNSDDPNFMFIKYLAGRQLMHGLPDGTFKPGNSLTRAEAAALLCRTADLAPVVGQTGFSDVPAGHWAAGDIAAAARAGYLSGYPDGTFKPGAALTRAEGTALFLRLSGQPGSSVMPALPADIQPGYWAENEAALAVASGMVLPLDGNRFAPGEPLTRGDLARLLAILITRAPDLYDTVLTGTLSVTRGQVTLTRSSGEQIAVESGDRADIGAGDSLSTGVNTTAEITFPDGTGFRLEPGTRLSVGEARGRSYIKSDGTPGNSVEWLEIDLKQGGMYCVLSSKHDLADSGNVTRGTAMDYALLAALETGTPEMVAVASQSLANHALPWWQVSQSKRTRVQVDMPWSVAAVRGSQCYISPQRVFTLLADVVVSCGGREVNLANGQYTETRQGEAPTEPAGLTEQQKKDWLEPETMSWLLDRQRQVFEMMEAEQVNYQTDTMEQFVDFIEQAEIVLQDDAFSDAVAEFIREYRGLEGRTDYDGFMSDFMDAYNNFKESLDTVSRETEDNDNNSDNTGGGGGDDDGNSDTSPPVVVSSAPADGESEVPVDTEISITFNESVVESVYFDEITLATQDTQDPLPVELSLESTTLTIQPYAELEPSVVYSVYAPAGAVKDAAGNGFAAGYSFTFTTESGVTLLPYSLKITTTLASVSTGGAQANDYSDYIAISDNGQYLVFVSNATNLDERSSDGKAQVYLRDLIGGTTELVSLDSDGVPLADVNKFKPDISDDGRYVVFYGTPAYYNPKTVYLRDRQEGTITVIGEGSETSISGNGQYVAYHRYISGTYYIYLYNVAENSLSQLFLGEYPACSGNGDYLAYWSGSSIHVYDIENGGTSTKVDVSSDGEPATGGSYYPQISWDGRYVSYQSFDDTLTSEENIYGEDIYVHDRDADQDGIFDEQGQPGAVKTVLASKSSAGIPGNGASGNTNGYGSMVSGDGRFVVFESEANNLVCGDMNNAVDIFLRDTREELTYRVNISSQGDETEKYADSWYPVTSEYNQAKGQLVIAFVSEAENLVGLDIDVNDNTDIFVATLEFGPPLADAVSPYILTSEPEDGDAGASYWSDEITLFFNEAVVAGDSIEEISIWKNYGTESQETVSYTIKINGCQVSLDTGYNLDPMTGYTVVIPTGAFNDLAVTCWKKSIT